APLRCFFTRDAGMVLASPGDPNTAWTILMIVRLRIGGGLVLLALAAASGCSGVQDSTQPPVGSISVPARRDDSELTTSRMPAQPARNSPHTSRAESHCTIPPTLPPLVDSDPFPP